MHDTLTTQPEQAVADLGKSPFDSIRRFREDGSEFWSARDLQGLLGYREWRKFQDAIERAKFSAQIESDLQLPGAGKQIGNDFVGAAKIVSLGAGGSREVEDVHLSRFACYLVAMNGDSRKPEIAAAHRYFAIRTRQAELAEKVVTEEQARQAKELAELTENRLATIEDIMESQQVDIGNLQAVIGALQGDAEFQRKEFEALKQAREARNPNAPGFDPKNLLGNYMDEAVYWFLRRFARPRPTGGWETTVTEIARGIGVENYGNYVLGEIEEILEDLGYKQGRQRFGLGTTWFRISKRPAPMADADCV
jgi:hypothetical protein